MSDNYQSLEGSPGLKKTQTCVKDGDGVSGKVQVLRTLAECYESVPTTTQSFFNCPGGSCHSIFSPPDAPNEIYYGEDNYIKSYDMVKKESKTIFRIDDDDPNNVFMFTLMKDGRLINADMNDVTTIDTKSQKVIARIENRQLGETWPFFRKIQLVEDEKFLMGLTSQRLYKLDLQDRNRIT